MDGFQGSLLLYGENTERHWFARQHYGSLGCIGILGFCSGRGSASVLSVAASVTSRSLAECRSGTLKTYVYVHIDIRHHAITSSGRVGYVRDDVPE